MQVRRYLYHDSSGLDFEDPPHQPAFDRLFRSQKLCCNKTVFMQACVRCNQAMTSERVIPCFLAARYNYSTPPKADGQFDS